MHIQFKQITKKLFLVFFMWGSISSAVFAHVGGQALQKQEVAQKPQASIKLVALKRVNAPYLVTTLGHRMLKSYSLVNRYRYVSLTNQYKHVYSDELTYANTVRPFINYQGSRAY